MDRQSEEIVETSLRKKRTRQQRYRGHNREKVAAAKRLERRRRPFIMWDGEGTTDAGYCLFGSSDGDMVQHPDLSSRECLELILESGERNKSAKAIHFGFAFDYDVNMILKDLPWRCLNLLRAKGSCTWEDFTIQHIPHKWFVVSDGVTTTKIYDVFAFFGCSYIKALDQYNIGNKIQREFIRAGKLRRDIFTYDGIDDIRDYWHTELLLGPMLMDHIRLVLDDAGYPITSWHGPGALARYELNKRKVKSLMKESPADVWLAARYAYTGGRFELFQAGYYDGPVYNYDINSAYPYAITKLPNLATGFWRRIPNPSRNDVSADKFAIYHIKYREDGPGYAVEPKPLFIRLDNDSVRWTKNTNSWYWSPEAALVKDNVYAEFVDCWEYVDDGTKPFKWVNEAYDQRMMLKRIGSPLQLGIKLMLNSMYGQFAQRVGWEYEGKAPSSHQLEWAGYITSVCKAMVYRAGLYAFHSGGLVSIDTDGIYSTTRIPPDVLTNGIGDGLGQWGSDVYSGILCWQSGVYWLRDNEGNWNKPKSRGAPSGTINIDNAWEAIRTRTPIEYTRHSFIGYRAAMQGRYDDWRQWKDQVVRLEFAGSDGGKRFHPTEGVMQRACNGCVTGKGMHTTFINPTFSETHDSKMHALPWIDNDHDRPWEFDALMFDQVIDEVQC